MTEQNTRRGILFVIAAAMIFAVQDGTSRHLADEYNVWMVVMIRYWGFAAFVTLLAARAPGGLRGAVATPHPLFHTLRGLILVVQIYVVVVSLVVLGLVDTHAVFACSPLIIVALSGPVLGESVGWRRWMAIGAGFVGILIILRPGGDVLTTAAILPLLAAALNAAYVLLTRTVARSDPTATSFFWIGTVGVVVTTATGLWFWEPMALRDWGWMTVLWVTGAGSHWLLIRAYETAEASALQPFAYFTLVFGSTIGITVFGDRLVWNVALGAAIVVGAGLFTAWRERVRSRPGRDVPPA